MMHLVTSVCSNVMCLFCVFIVFFYYVGITGTVSIDENGDRNADYSLLDLNPETDKFEVCNQQL